MWLTSEKPEQAKLLVSFENLSGLLLPELWNVPFKPAKRNFARIQFFSGWLKLTSGKACSTF